MAQFILQVPDEQRSRVVEAFCHRFGYTNKIPDGSGGEIDNPETRNQFTKRMMVDWVKSQVIEAEVDMASRSAAQAARGVPPPDMS